MVGKRIVICDDDLDDQLHIEEAFRKLNNDFEFSAFTDGTQLMDYLLKQGKHITDNNPDPDFIILDLNMPILDGIHTLKKIKASEKLRHLPIYVVTTSRNEEQKRLVLNLGAINFFSKPSTIEGYNEIVNSICS